jgi:hypothetical protein
MQVHTVTIRQSTLKSWLMCPRSFWHKTWGDVTDPTSDAALIGTAMHAGIEFILHGGDAQQAHRRAQAELDLQWDECRKVTYKSHDVASAWVTKLLDQWLDTVYPQVPAPLVDSSTGLPMIEWPFNVTAGYIMDGTVEVRFSGTADYVDENGVVWDWKSAGRKYEQWEVDRWHVQPSVYTYALSQSTGDFYGDFQYGVMVRGNGATGQVVQTTRTAGDHQWVISQAHTLAAQIVANARDMNIWMTNDQGWWCSPKWCPAWDQCKGAVTCGNDVRPAQ